MVRDCTVSEAGWDAQNNGKIECRSEVQSLVLRKLRVLTGLTDCSSLAGMSKEAAEANLATLSNFAKNYLPILFNVCGQTVT